MSGLREQIIDVFYKAGLWQETHPDHYINAIESAGFVIVPREATQEQRDTGALVVIAAGMGRFRRLGTDSAAVVYRAMIAAASPPPREGE